MSFPEPRSWREGDRLAVNGAPQRIVPFVVGFEVIAEAISVAGGSRFRHLLEPVTAVAVVFDEGWVLIDGGFDPARIRDRERRIASFDYENYTAVVPAGDPLVDQVAAAGLEWSALAAALLTHAHFDHTGAARMLAPHQPLIMQRREWQHVVTTTDPRMDFLFVDDVVRPGLDVIVLDGDVELAPGLAALDTAGHTPGHQSFAVTLPDRTVVLAGDAADLRINIDSILPTGATVGADGDALAVRAIERLAALDAHHATEVWPAHDPDWEPWQRALDAAVAQAKESSDS
ncbi:glyoxylase-like metal-dependent hydrolase (beta-lactamase superfamily II) [Microbacterium endophyticum]|uniref:Glyoxylase-like metal-dependent hydrolase (Beta-lactamase superfamily II) n=1 Tax=Microbacterium endophyticum TaxID=1526412 RepID=A0A7W4V279_9MICO|nr:MBL fold metallo-hydrolase [Microbacterium endophyticum]MBB2975389.1 glyoxylase-like metal-dependent hydrolase (beta-lactamase superfamily II) [Microbacterium endophyticum]NIK35592.1 glyoxylase-like metal-dependent hydrolase (beta-lactamase superfamily II) [Microbacterium endophyticum]